MQRSVRRASLFRHAAVALLAAALAAQFAHAKSIALLVGVSDYGSQSANLEGPVHDVAALRDVLQRRWGFAAGVIHTLTDKQATKAGILNELRALQSRSSAGDDLFIYFSGYGTSALDSTLRVPVPHGSGAFVPYKIKTEGATVPIEQLLVGRTDLLPLLKALDDGGRRVWLVSDSCYSDNQARSIVGGDSGALPMRAIPLVVQLREQERLLRDEALLATRRKETPPYPYRNTSTLAASGEREVARDIPRRMLQQIPTVDGKPHGAFTDALLRVLEGQIPGDMDRDGLLSLNEAHRAVSDFMSSRAYGHAPVRLPALVEDQSGLGARAVFAAKGVAAPPKQRGPEPLRLRIAADLPAALHTAAAGVPQLRVLEPSSGNAAATGTETPDIVLSRFKSKPAVATASGDFLAFFEPDRIPDLQQQLQQLAWAQRLRHLGEKHRRAVLPLEIHPAIYNGNFRIGQTLYFAVQPDRPAWLVLLHIKGSILDRRRQVRGPKGQRVLAKRNPV